MSGNDYCWTWKSAAHMWCIFMAQSWRWEWGHCEVCFCSGAFSGHISAAASVAALDSDWFRHVYTKQGAEGLWLGGAHAGDGS